MPYTPATHAAVVKYDLSVSTNPSRSGGQFLQGANLTGNVYVYTNGPSGAGEYFLNGISGVCFWLDNTSMSGPAYHCESASPYDFNSTGNGAGNPWNTNKVSAGTHTITQRVTRSDATTDIATATFTVNSAVVAPSITAQPTSQAVTAGQAVTFAVAANGTAPLSYQWRKNGANISGATSSSYTTPVTTTADSGSQFTAVVSNTAGNATSNAATLTVNPAPVAPSISSQPASQTVTAGQSATFSVSANGTAPLSYQWTKNGTVISGANSATYTTTATTTADSGAQFTVAVSNSTGSVTSNAATLTVNPALVTPLIISQPVSQAVTVGQTASFSVSASGTAPLSYQWRKNGVNIGGATSANYTTPPTVLSDNGTGFSAVVTNSAGSASSSTASLTVNPLPLQITTTSLPGGTQGASYSASLAATGGVPPYSWSLFSGQLPAGITLQSSGTLSGTPTQSGAFTFVVQVADVSTNSTSATFSINVAPQALPTITITSPANGATVSGTITVTGTASSGVALSFVQVQIDGGSFSNATGTSNWTYNLNTGSLSNGSHTINARATDTSSNTKDATISINVSNTNPAVNVLNFGAIGNGLADDTLAIQSAITALLPGNTLFFPCGTYKISSQLSLSKSNITVDGGNCATIRSTASGTIFSIGVTGNGNPSYGGAVALSATANELSTSFTTVSSIGVSAGDYVRLQQGGKDSSTGSGDTGCDPSGCRGELLKISSVSGNTITVTTALHDTYNPAVNGATAQKVLNPVTGLAMRNISLDGSSASVYGLAIAGVADSTVSGVTAKNLQGAAILSRGNFNVSWSNITVTGAGSAQCGSAVWFENQGDLNVNGMSITNENPGAPGSGCLANGAFGFELIASANSTFTNLMVDAAGAYGRPFKTAAARWNTFNTTTVKNGVQAYNGISLEYYSSHNTFNSCVVTNNGPSSGTANGNAGINSFGNFNQFNSFNNCTVTGNGNVQVLVNNWDALRLGQDLNIIINGGTYAGSNTVEPVIYIIGAQAKITSATIRGQGAQGIYLGSTSACVNNNTFVSGTGLSTGIFSSGTSNIGSGNVMNGTGSNLTPGTCTAP